MADKIEHWDVIVIGAGVAGALVAWRLATSGLRVLVLEAGAERSDRVAFVGAYASALSKTVDAPYADSSADAHAPSPKASAQGTNGYYEQVGPDPFKSTYLRMAGGSTWHWLGNVPRLVPNDFRMHTQYGVGVDWPITYDELEPYYAEAERQIGVSGSATEWDGLHGAWRSGEFPMPPVWPAYGDRLAARALEGMLFEGADVRLRVTPQARNSITYQGRPPCAGNSSCVPLCPIAAKYDATVHIRLAQNAASSRGGVAAQFRYRSNVTAVHAEADGRVSQVEYFQWDADGKRTPVKASARVVVLAAHAIETPMILLRSGLSKSGPVGRYLMDHPQGYVAAILSEPVFPFRGPPVTSGVDAFRDGPFRSHRAAFRVSIGNDGWGQLQPLEETVRSAIFGEKRLGTSLRNAINHRVTRMMRMSYSTELLPERTNQVSLGSLDADGNIRPRLHFSVPSYNVRAFNFAKAFVQRMFERMGAVGELAYSHPSSKFSGAGHIMGTCRMGNSATDSVVDSTGRAHEHRNLYLVGASVFPTSGTANPTLTVAALALRTAEQIVKDFA
jgi:choline dehydrogenase-like flavoprotein